MSGITLAITQPAHGSGLDGPVALRGTATGNVAGLFFKWYSPLNPAATQAHPEINIADHGPNCLNGTVSALAEFGTHALTLAATDRDGTALADIRAIRRSALAGGAPPAAPAPCVVHQLRGAAFRTPAADGQGLSRASATIEVLAPGVWARPGAAPGSWVANADYQALNGVALALRLEPAVAAPDPAKCADIALAPLAGLPFFHAEDKTWLRLTRALPANLGNGAHRLLLRASAGGASVTVARQVVLTA
ncbi:hypothetical protein [Azohydromonas aeria]|uniref:hypothetical protein n=1 Tax=Azohydromonas aeria TaxID=2590212 RepID=UPI0012FAE28D|nr:hypothetical protein [Azohydromonas aeria]